MECVPKPQSTHSILVVGLSWPPETFLENLIRGLAEAGLRLTLSVGRKPDAKCEEHPNIDWLYAPGWDAHAPARRLAQLALMITSALRRSPGDVRKFLPYIQQENSLVAKLRLWHRLLPYAGSRWDTIYFPWNSAAIDHLPLFDLAMPVVLSCRGAQIFVAPHNPKRRDIRDGLRTTFDKATVVHCVCKAISLEAIQFGLDPRKTQIIYPAVDTDFFYPNEYKPRTTGFLKIVSVGSLIWRKGYEYALQAIRILADKGVPVLYNIIGDGPDRARIIYTIQDLHLEEHVNLRGTLLPSQVRQQLQQSDVFLLPSVSEGMSNAALEAMACGLPIVSTDCGGMREAITDDVQGFLVPVRDPEAIADALMNLWIHPDLRPRMGQAGRIKTLKQFTLKKQVEIFKEMVSQTARVGAAT